MFKNATTHAALQLGKFIVRFGCVDMLEHLAFLFEKNIMNWTSYLTVVNYNMSLHVFFSLKNDKQLYLCSNQNFIIFS